MRQEVMGFLGCNGISWTICKQSAQRSRHLITRFFTFRVLFVVASQQCQSTEGSIQLVTPIIADISSAIYLQASATRPSIAVLKAVDRRHHNNYCGWFVLVGVQPGLGDGQQQAASPSNSSKPADQQPQTSQSIPTSMPMPPFMPGMQPMPAMPGFPPGMFPPVMGMRPPPGMPGLFIW